MFDKQHMQSLFKFDFKRITTICLLSSLMIAFNNCGQDFEASNLNSVDGNNLQSNFQCSDTSKTSYSTPYFLSKKQLQNTIEDIFGTDILNEIETSFSTLTSDNFDEDTHKRLTSISAEKIQAYFNIAKSLANSATSNSLRKTQIFGACSNNTNLSSSCLNDFLNNKATQIMRRPPNQTEIDFTQSIASSNTYGNTDEKLRAILMYYLQSPYFILRVELGSNSSNISSNLNLSPYETATRLSYQLTDSTPDIELLTAAKNNNLSDEQLKYHARRLLLSARGKKKAIESLLHWSLSSQTSDLSNLPESLLEGINTEGLEEAMVDEARKFIEHIVFDKNGRFSELLGSKKSFASHTGLAKIYNHVPVTGEEPLKFPGTRKGLLMRAPFLTWTGPRTNIIKRGVEFQKRVLCNKIPEPTVDISDDRNSDARSPAEALMHTNRDNIKELTKSPACMGCHSTINPTGFAYEEFDSLGRQRFDEQIFDEQGNFYTSIPVDTTTYIPLPGNGTQLVNNASDLSDYIANSAIGNECLIRNIHRFYNEKKEETEDGCHLNNTFEKLANQKMSIIDVIVNIAVSKNLRFKKSI